MKEYEKQNGNYILLLCNNIRCYSMNHTYHGFYFSISYKGYLNMDEEYGHWKEYANFNEYKYFL